MRTTVDLDADLLERLRDEADRRGVPFKDALARAVRRGLGDKPRSSAARYRCPVFHMGGVRGGIDLDKALGVAAHLEDEEVAEELLRRK
jgi:hypothetical protein